MYQNDHIRPIIKKFIQLYKKESYLGKKDIAINAEKAFNKIKCYVCMDTNQLWDDRQDFFSRNFAGNNYDLFRCNVCSDGGFIDTCNYKTDYKKGRERDGNIISYQIELLSNLYIDNIKPDEERKEKIKKEKEEKELENKKKLEKRQQEIDSYDTCVWDKCYHEEFDIEMKNKSLSINIGEISDKVIKIVRAYSGDFTAAASLIKNLTLELQTSFSEVSESKESFDVTEPDIHGNSKYVIIKIKKLEKEKSSKIHFNFNKSKYIYKYEYLILSPKNKKAREECNKLVNKNVSDIINRTKKIVKL